MKLIQDKKTNWNGVRNFQARNHLKKIAAGDLLLIYHSGDEKSIVGIAQALKIAYPDPDSESEHEWVQIDIEAIRVLKRKISLSELKATPALAQLPLIKQSRLSVMPIQAMEYKMILEMEKA